MFVYMSNSCFSFFPLLHIFINNFFTSFTFSPDVATNSITYGLRGITRVSNDVIKNIIKNRPYTSFENFLDKNKTNKLQTLNLIKSGAFDKLEGSRVELMKRYIDMISDKKSRLTLQNMQMLLNYELIPEDMVFYGKLFMFNKYYLLLRLHLGHSNTHSIQALR